MADLSDDDIATIEAEMRPGGDGVWIDPAFARAHSIDADAERVIERVVEDSSLAQYRVVLTELDLSDPRFGNNDQLAAWLHDDLGGDATYVMWGYEHVELLVFGEQPDSLWADVVAGHEHPRDVTAQVERIDDLVRAGNAGQVWDDIPREEKYPDSQSEGTGSPGDSSGDSGAGVDVVDVALVLVAVLVVGWVIRSVLRAVRDVRTAAPGDFALPTTVLRSVREAEDRALRRRAEAEVLALGESVGAAPVGHTPASAQAALDHYAASRAVLDRSTSTADVVGALVLAARGRDALVAWRDGEPAWEPRPGCWFNPLHGESAERVKWSGRGSATSVPACAQCAAALARGVEPPDVLDFVSGERTEHYFTLPLGVWSRTGYGSVDVDLLGALVRSRRPSAPAWQFWRRRRALR